MCVCRHCYPRDWLISEGDMDEFEWEMFDESNEDGKNIWIPEVDFDCLHGSRLPERLH